MSFKAIDIHPHVISTDLVKFPRAPLGGHPSVWSQERPVSHEQMVKAMDEAGIDKSAIVQASTCYGHDNSYLAEAVAAHPKRFTGVFSADVLADNGPERIRYWVSKGLTGLRLFTVGSTMTTQSNWLDDPKTFPSWETVEELKIPMCLQVCARRAFQWCIPWRQNFPKCASSSTTSCRRRWKTARPMRRRRPCSSW